MAARCSSPVSTNAVNATLYTNLNFDFSHDLSDEFGNGFCREHRIDHDGEWRASDPRDRHLKANPRWQRTVSAAARMLRANCS
jgi:hypothetical protein